MKLGAAIVFTLFAVLITLFFMGKPVVICDQSHPLVSFAKNLSQEKMAALFNEAENAIPAKKRWREPIIPLKTNLSLDNIYAIKDSRLHYWTDDHANIKLASCNDHSVSLDLANLNKPNGSISLYWGEGSDSGEKLLWKKSQ